MTTQSITSDTMIFVTLLLMTIAVATIHGAESEVWSEQDGTEYKYRTDHNELLSTKGSQIEQRTHGQTPANGATQQDESANSNTNSAAGDNSEAGETGQTTGASNGNNGPGAEESNGQNGESNVESSGNSSDVDDESSENVEQGADSAPARRTAAAVAAMAAAAAAAGGANPVTSTARSSPAATRGEQQRDQRDYNNENDAAIPLPQSNDESSNADNGNDEEITRPNGQFDANRRLRSQAPVNEDQPSFNDRENVDHDDNDNQQQYQPVKPISDTGDESPEQLRASPESDDSVARSSSGPVNNRMVDFDHIVRNSQRAQGKADGGNAQVNQPDINYEMVNVHQSNSGFPGARRGFANAGRLHSGVMNQQHQHHHNQAKSSLRITQDPDSERDHFQSPGHFPGSMAHLTQAASRQHDVAVKSTAESASATTVAATAATTTMTNAKQSPSADESVSTPVSTVTQQSFADIDQQQIQAPTVVVTTTLPPSTRSEPSSGVNTNNRDLSSSVTTERPVFKRFLFRKLP